jgi:hypothetical protein
MASQVPPSGTSAAAETTDEASAVSRTAAGMSWFPGDFPEGIC